MGTSFHWYLMIECDNRSPVGKAYAKVAFRFMQKLSEVSSQQSCGRETLPDIRRRKASRSETYFDAKANWSSYSPHELRRFEARKMEDRKRSKSSDTLLAIAKTTYRPCLHLYHFPSMPALPSHPSLPKSRPSSSPTYTLYYSGSRRPRWSLRKS